MQYVTTGVPQLCISRFIDGNVSSLVQFAKTAAADDEIFEGGVLKSHIVLMYNRERIDSEDAAEIAVEDGDEVVLYPPVSGG